MLLACIFRQRRPSSQSALICASEQECAEWEQLFQLPLAQMRLLFSAPSKVDGAQVY